MQCGGVAWPFSSGHAVQLCKYGCALLLCLRPPHSPCTLRHVLLPCSFFNVFPWYLLAQKAVSAEQRKVTKRIGWLARRQRQRGSGGR